jgi:hypothetical protein
MHLTVYRHSDTGNHTIEVDGKVAVSDSNKGLFEDLKFILLGKPVEHLSLTVSLLPVKDAGEVD